MTLAADTWVQALADVQGAVESHREAITALRKLVEPMRSAADMRTVKLTATTPTNDAAAKHRAKSFTVVNPYGFTINIGVGGVGATNVAAFSLPPMSFVTLPITAENMELGADAGDLAGGDAYLFVFLYDAVQPFAMGDVT